MEPVRARCSACAWLARSYEVRDSVASYSRSRAANSLADGIMRLFASCCVLGFRAVTGSQLSKRQD